MSIGSGTQMSQEYLQGCLPGMLEESNKSDYPAMVASSANRAVSFFSESSDGFLRVMG